MQFSRSATSEDVLFVASNMRQGDVEECKAGGFTPLDALTFSYASSFVAYTLLTPQDVPAAILGVSPSPVSDSLGVLWMLGTDDIKTHKFTFLRNCKPYLSYLFEITGKEAFYNYTYHENALHHQWLKWLGFTFLRKVDLPPQGRTFYEFVKLKDNN